MKKLIIFDLDGVLIDTRDFHFEVLNKALSEVSNDYIISVSEHLKKYDGLSTRKKLDMLTEEKGLSKDLHDTIWKDKQKYTLSELPNYLSKDEKLIELFQYYKDKGFKVCVASNSIRETVKVSLTSIGVIHLVDRYYSNEDVNNPKPHPEIYMKCMIDMGVSPKETLIVEDSYIGRTAALDSGASLCPVKNRCDVTIDEINSYLNVKVSNNQWKDKKMNVVIPMAGAGSRFANAGFTFPKPLIEVNGKPMIQLVIENLNVDANFIFLVQRKHYEKYNLESFLKILSPGCDIIITDGLTEGACCTTLLAEELINNDNPLLIANSDQFIEWDANEFYHSVNNKNIDGSILIFENTHPKWSYVKCDDSGNVTELKEKEVISNNATVGIYFWSKGSDYVKYSHDMINKNIRVNGEFYVAPVYNESIADGKVIKTYNIDKMWGLGTPEDLDIYLKNKA